MAFDPYSHKIAGQFEYRGILYYSANANVDINMMDDYRPDPTDVLIASYPKTGASQYNKLEWHDILLLLK